MNIGYTSMDFSDYGMYQVELDLVSANHATLENFVSHLSEEGDGKPMIHNFDSDMLVHYNRDNINLSEVRCYFSLQDSEELIHWLLKVAHTWEIAFEMWSANVDVHIQEYAHANHTGLNVTHMSKEWYAEEIERGEVIEGEIGGFKNFGKFKSVWKMY